ncbi:MAG: class I SAM-dependent methyltransferase [Thermoproteota archaeon]|nr:class I SAM-dependent methyltransferase [Thermoproteota archaeon]
MAKTRNNNDFDIAKSDAFLERVVGDITGAYTTIMCCIGDKLGLFKKLSSNGPLSSVQLARLAGIDERYAREWLYAMSSAGYVFYHPSTQKFCLPVEHVPILAKEGSPVFLAGMYQSFLAEIKNMGKLIEKFREGGGISLDEFDDDEFVGMERMTASWFENLLLSEWIPSVPAVKNSLEKGIDVADVGCGRGRAVIKLAQSFPNSRFVGYDVVESAINYANSQALSLGLEDQVKFKKLDVSQGIPEEKYYDLITTFDVIHDLADPMTALLSIKKALKQDGTYLWLEINSKDKVEDNFGQTGTLLYSWSIVYCMTTSLANNGLGLGALGMPPSRVKKYCSDAGFSHVRKLPVDNPFNVLYEVKI